MDYNGEDLATLKAKADKIDLEKADKIAKFVMGKVAEAFAKGLSNVECRMCEAFATPQSPFGEVQFPDDKKTRAVAEKVILILASKGVKHAYYHKTIGIVVKDLDQD
eukprot:GDKK01018798.1.p1 GENE.GDKK01018798.1~~GDKK01018798.1.p1  ORF type:complete len:118 (-),score=29.64 GDKK01018798.1:90-410(-)